MNGLNEEVLKTLKCSCCAQYMSGPIYECLSGHNICSNCRDKNLCKVCSVCQAAFRETRKFSLESIRKVVQYPCTYEDQGCREFFKSSELNEHQQHCDYRTYNCKLEEDCLWQGKRKELLKHCVDKHDYNVLIGNEVICLWKHSKPNYAVQLMLALEQRFYIHRKLKNGIMYWAVQYIGRPEDIILFCFEIQIFTDQFKDRRLEFSEICHDDVREDIDEIIDTGFCVAVPLNILETYLNTQQVLLYKIKIKQA